MSDGMRVLAEMDIEIWKRELPSDLRFGTFADDFLIDGVHYVYGAWDVNGEWAMAWNTDEEYWSQLNALSH